MNVFFAAMHLCTWGNRGLSSLDFLIQSATSLFMALGQLLYSLLRSGDRYPRPTMKMIWGGDGGQGSGPVRGRSAECSGAGTPCTSSAGLGAGGEASRQRGPFLESEWTIMRLSERVSDGKRASERGRAVEWAREGKSDGKRTRETVMERASESERESYGKIMREIGMKEHERERKWWKEQEGKKEWWKEREKPWWKGREKVVEKERGK